jgi:hypothetical protein
MNQLKNAVPAANPNTTRPAAKPLLIMKNDADISNQR